MIPEDRQEDNGEGAMPIAKLHKKMQKAFPEMSSQIYQIPEKDKNLPVRWGEDIVNVDYVIQSLIKKDDDTHERDLGSRELKWYDADEDYNLYATIEFYEICQPLVTYYNEVVGYVKSHRLVNPFVNIFDPDHLKKFITDDNYDFDKDLETILKKIPHLTKKQIFTDLANGERVRSVTQTYLQTYIDVDFYIKLHRTRDTALYTRELMGVMELE